ncbi:MAG: amidohydrolase family protein [Minisyncoccia bacterium]
MKRTTRTKLRNAKIIDNHVHLSIHPESRAKIGYLEDSMRKNGIDLAVALAAYFPRKTGSISNGEALSLAEKYENILIFGSLDAEHNFENGTLELESLLRRKKIFGIKLYPGYQYFYPNEKKLDAIYELASKFNVPVMFHSGLAYRSPGGIRFSRPIYIDDVAGSFQSMKIVISHLGDPSIREATAVAHKNPNVYLDFSGLVSNTTKNQERAERWQKLNEEYIARTVADVLTDLMGTEKIIFGSDWPISSHEKSLALVSRLQKMLNLDREEVERMLSKNMLKVLGIMK